MASKVHESRFPANAVSRGIGIGRVVFPGKNSQAFKTTALEASQIPAEIARFESAVEHASTDLSKLADADPTGIFAVQQLILEDTFVDDVVALIRAEKVDAETGLRSISKRFVTDQSSLPDSHISEKYIDIQDVTDRLLKALAPRAESDKIPTGMVYIVDDLTPSKLLELARSHPKAVISSKGGWTSHAAILGRELRLPIVSGFRSADKQVSEGEIVIVDAVDGQIVLSPTRDTLRGFRLKRRALSREAKYAGLGVVSHSTSDGREIVIRVNANNRESYERAKRAGASGIGLFRSESLIDERIPTEDEQFAAYCAIGELVGSERVRIRTFDVGTRSPAPQNPALGLRAIRLGLSQKETFSNQVRAILRASARHQLDIVLPMVSGVDDVKRAKAVIEEQRKAITASGGEIGSPKLGVMIEVPSAVMTASAIAKQVDFLCLGTNDLVQYLLAVDRDDPSVAEWYQTLHPAVLRAIREVIAAGEAQRVPVELCGEMAGSPFYVPLLIGLGAIELSINSSAVEPVRRLISGLDTARCVELAHLTNKDGTADEVAMTMRDFYRRHWNDLFPPEVLA